MEINKTKTLSVAEIELLSRLEFEGKEIYAREEITSFFKNRKKASYLIKKLLEKGRLVSIVRNTYFLIPIKAPKGQWAGNEYLIAKALARRANYYIGYSSVFNSYGFTDQVAQVIHVVNDLYSMQKTIFGVRYKMIKVLPDRIYGLEERKIDNKVVLFSKKERAMIDVFEFYPANRAYDILKEQIDKLDICLFIDYVAQYPVQIIRRRLGYFLEQLGAKLKLLNKIKAGTRGYSLLYGDRITKGKLNKKWRVIVNG